jgi:hypothetical protein
MISCSLMGGLGNQLFQIFTTVAFSIKLSRKCVFLYEDFARGGETLRPTYWNTFLKSIKYMTTFPLPVLHPTIMKEKHFHYEEMNFAKMREIEYVNLLGYFQSYKYFDEYRETLFKLIRLEDTRTKVMKMYACLNAYGEKYERFDEIISMHFRIGDYIKYPDVHPILPYDYYYNSLLFIQQKDGFGSISNKNVLYFCEDSNIEHVHLCIARLQKEFPDTQFQRAPDILEDWQQLTLMSCCKYNIIANSTFSWFAAYFNAFPDKIVCYPSLWFGKQLGHYVMKDLFPTTWNKIVANNTIGC